MGGIADLAARGQLTIENAATLIARANPNATPRDIVAGLNKAMPFLKAEEQLQVAQLRIDMQQQRAEETERYHKELEAERRRSAEQRDVSLGQRQQEIERREKHEARMAVHQEFNQDQALKNYALKQLQFEERARATGKKEDLEAAKEQAKLGMDMAKLKLQNHNFMYEFKPGEKEALIKDAQSVYDEYVDKLRKMGGGTAPSSPTSSAAPVTSKPAAGSPQKTKTMTHSERKWYEEQFKTWSPEQQQRVRDALKAEGYDTGGL
jgi:hypothetical protein